jgi:histone deacetylase 11
MAVLVYSPRYDLGLPILEKLHSFSGSRPSRAFKSTMRQLNGLKRPRVVTPTRGPTDDELLEVHTQEYISSLKRSSVWAKILEGKPLRFVPPFVLNWLVQTPMRFATSGSVLATREALTAGLAINFGGGYHHAKPAHGEGFCAISDIGLLVATARRLGWIGPGDIVVYVDTDAHQGNGPSYVFMDDPRVMLYDIFNVDEYPCVEDPIYPYPVGGDAPARERLDCAVPLARGSDDTTYLTALRSTLPAFLEKAGKKGRIGLAIYNAGTDVVAGDSVGGLGLTHGAVLARDMFAINEFRQRNIPTVMLPSGGYTHASAELIAATAAEACRRW